MSRLFVPAMLAGILASNLAIAQSADTAHYTRKSPTTAFVLSFLVTGTGQMYAGKPGLGATLLALSVSGTALFAQGVRHVDTCQPVSHIGCSTGPKSEGNMLAGFGMVAISWIAGIVEAPDAARDYNKKHGVAPVVTTGAHGSTRLGVTLAF